MKYHCVLCDRKNFDSKQPHKCKGGFRKRGIAWKQLKSNNMEQQPQDQREYTFGEKLVGLTFNPSGDADVQRAKELCAELADLVNKCYNNPLPPNENHRPLYELLFKNAITEILNAQMNAVKVITFKY